MELLELEKVIKGESSQKPMQYRLYSMHDTDIGNLLYSLVPSYNFSYVPYASNIIFEVYKAPQEDKTGFVRAWYNGMQMDIDGCSKDACTIEEFTNSLRKNLVVADPASLKQQCDMKPLSLIHI